LKKVAQEKLKNSEQEKLKKLLTQGKHRDKVTYVVAENKKSKTT
jgi:hypothetical protein